MPERPQANTSAQPRDPLIEGSNTSFSADDPIIDVGTKGTFDVDDPEIDPGTKTPFSIDAE